MRLLQTLGGRVGIAALVVVAVGGGAVVVGTVTSGNARPSGRDAEPQFVEIVTATPADLGELPVLAKAAREVVFRNRAAFPVRLEVVAVTCGGLKPSLSATRLGPGATATFRVETDVQGERGVQHHRAMLRATSDVPGRLDGFAQRIDLDIVYRAAVEYFVFPLRLVAHQPNGNVGRVSFVIRPHNQENIRALDVQTSFGESVRITQHPMRAEAGSGVFVELETSLEVAGAYTGLVRVLTDSETHPEFTLPLHIRVEPRVEDSRQTIVLNGANGQGVVTRRVALLRSPAGDESEPSAVVVTPRTPGLEARLVQADGETQLEVSIRFSESPSPTGVGEVALIGPTSAELARYRVLWIGSLERLASELGQTGEAKQGEIDR